MKKNRRGAPKGNQNAKGHGAPPGNTNAETHGAYSRPRLERLSPEQRSEIDGMEAEFTENAYRTMKISISGGKTMDYTFKSSPFSRRMTLETELNRVDGRIIKLLDSIKNKEAEQRRLELERERLEFQKQKTIGIFHFAEDGTVIPDDDEEEIVET